MNSCKFPKFLGDFPDNLNFFNRLDIITPLLEISYVFMEISKKSWKFPQFFKFHTIQLGLF